MRIGWTAAAAGLIVAGCSATVSGLGTPASTPRAVASSRPAPSGSAPASRSGSPDTGPTLSTPSPTAASGDVAASTCAPVFFGVAGSGQGPQNPPPTDVPAGVSRPDARRYGTAIGLVKTDLATLAHHRLATTQAIDYPATGLPNWVGPGGLTQNLDASEAQGVVALLDAITSSERGSCLGRPVLLAGYSQGAEVVILAVNALTPAQRTRVTVALFGNPSYEPGEVGDYPGTTRARGVRPAFTGAGYSLPADVRARTLDICAAGDPVCGMSPAARTLSDKLGYLLRNADIHASAYAFGRADYAKLAAQFLWRHR